MTNNNNNNNNCGSSSGNGTTKNNKDEEKNDEEEMMMTPEQRMEWLREHGIEIVTPENRKEKQMNSNNNNDNNNDDDDDDDEKNIIHYVKIPADISQPIKELIVKKNKYQEENDILLHHLKSVFSTTNNGRNDDRNDNNNDVDLTLLPDSSKQLLSSSSSSLSSSNNGSDNNNNIPPKISQSTLSKLAQEGMVEIFPLVRPTSSNKYVGINIYLDEIGMLKRLPINQRAKEYAMKCGYNPPPTFYGNIYIGRIQGNHYNNDKNNLSFRLEQDVINQNALWLRNATSDNLSYQMEYNRITNADAEKRQQPPVVGTENKPKQETSSIVDGQYPYTWTQTEEEIEIVLPIKTEEDNNNNNSNVIKSKDIRIKFQSQSIQVTIRKRIVLLLSLFQKIDHVDGGSTWTIENDNDNGKKIVITMEKMDPSLWSRIQY